MSDSNEPDPKDPIPDEVDKGLALAYGGDSTPAPSPSVLKRIADLTGSEPKISLREEDVTGEAPMLKPLGSDSRPEAGKYVVQGELGRGGVGAVHRGHDQDLGRDVAIKFLHEKYRSEPTVMHRFVEEAQIGGQLQHPGIVTVYDLGMVDGKPFFAMKLVKGVTLAKKLSDRESVESDRRTFLSTFEDVCQTMAYAHARNVVHRDLKPANIMIGSFGEVQIVDWGMGKVLQPGGVTEEKPAAEPQVEVSLIETARSAGHGTQSVMGSVMGTPAYMPPEQARGNVDAMDERSDVFALGAILCEILTGQPPYVGAGVHQLLMMAESGNLAGAHARLAASGADADLVELTTQCLLPEPADRPRSAAEVAESIHTHLASAEARAHDATVRALALKRTQVLGISLTVVIAICLAASLWFWRDATEQTGFAVEAAAKEKQAAAGEKEARTLADQRSSEAQAALTNFNRLSYTVRLEAVKAAERATYPAWPDKADAIRDWLAADAKALQEALPELRESLTELRAGALPQSEAEAAASVETHPRFAELAAKRAKLGASRAAQAVRAGAEPAEVVLELSKLPKNPQLLAQLATDLVGPDRTEFGSEARGLALARHAMSMAPASGPGQVNVTVALAWALFANGLDDDARTQREAVFAASGELANPRWQDSLMMLDSAMAAAKSPESATAIAQLAVEVETLQAEVEQRWSWTFADPADQFLHDTLRSLIAEVERLAAIEVAAAGQRLEWAERVQELTITRYSDLWNEARLAILRADGVLASKLYGNSPIELQPQVGLVPIGMNPVTLLWEFYHLRSAWDGTSDPTTIEIPTHGPEGEVTWKNGTGVKGDTGIVFVLLPGGNYTMGAQSQDPAGLNYDPGSGTDVVPHAEAVAPFFLARHELTKGQWARLWSGDESLRRPSYFRTGRVMGRRFQTLANPIENVSWSMSNELLLRHGLVMPSEAQWEYGCRAGTTTPYVCDLAALKDYANVGDQTARKSFPIQPAPWTDGHAGPAPVGSFSANAFGLHDVHGNVKEWCLDKSESGLRVGRSDASDPRVLRSGSFADPAVNVRSAARRMFGTAIRNPAVGLRPARTVRVPD